MKPWIFVVRRFGSNDHLATHFSHLATHFSHIATHFSHLATHFSHLDTHFSHIDIHFSHLDTYFSPWHTTSTHPHTVNYHGYCQSIFTHSLYILHVPVSKVSIPCFKTTPIYSCWNRCQRVIEIDNYTLQISPYILTPSTIFHSFIITAVKKLLNKLFLVTLFTWIFWTEQFWTALIICQNIRLSWHILFWCIPFLIRNKSSFYRTVFSLQNL